MIDAVRIKNFRCFRSAEAENLGRINLVVGDNGAGKTAFLEAVYFVNGNTPQNPLKTRQWRRGAGDLQVTADELRTGTAWDDLFRPGTQEEVVEIRTRGSDPRVLTIARQEVATMPVGDGPVDVPIKFTWRIRGGKEFSSVPKVSLQGATFPPGPEGPGGALLTGAVHGRDLANSFSDLDKANRADSVLAAIRAEWPMITGISVQSEHGTPDLYAQVEHLQHKLPLGFVSSGIQKLAFILVTIARYHGGTVGVDEFETGIYHTRFPSVLKAIIKTSKSNNTQVFLSTHSGEAIAALGSVIQEDESDFRLIRIERDAKTGESHLHVSGGRNLAAAIESHIDVR